MSYELIFLVLIPASLFDLKCYKVPNPLIVAALFISLIRHIEITGIRSMYPWFLGIIIPFILTFLLFRCRMFGASDIKLFSVVGSFLGLYSTGRVLIGALTIGAVFAILKMYQKKNFLSRFRHFFNYVTKLKNKEEVNPYYSRQKDGLDVVIPFTVPLTFAVIIFS